MFWIVGVLVLFISLISAIVLAKHAQDLKLIAIPGEHRQHSQLTPTIGGLAMCIGMAFGILLAAPSHTPLLVPLIFICAVGVLDDRFTLPTWLRFLAQVMAATAMIYLSDIELHSLGALFSGKDILLGDWSKPITVFSVVGVINALNMSDGLDGLAGSIVVLVLIALLLINELSNDLIWISILSISGFLALNLRIARPRAAVFMGDAGSTLLGLLLAYLLIQQSQATNGILPVTALWLMALPLIDAVAVLIARPISGKSPFAADRIHYHHQLVDRGISVNKSLVLALLLQSVFIAMGIFALRQGVTETFQFYLFLLVFFLYLIKTIQFSLQIK